MVQLVIGEISKLFSKATISTESYNMSKAAAVASSTAAVSVQLESIRYRDLLTISTLIS